MITPDMKKTAILLGLLILPGSLITVPISYLIMKAMEKEKNDAVCRKEYCNKDCGRCKGDDAEL